MTQRRFTRFRRQELRHFRKFQRQTAFVNHVRHTVFVVHRERFAPVTLTRKDSIAQAIVHLYAAQLMFFYIFLGSGNGFLDSQSVQIQIAVRSSSFTWRVAHDTFLGIKALFADITAFHQRTDFQSEVLGKSIVTAVVSRHRHDGSRTVSSQYIVADPDGHCLAGKRIDAIRTAEHTRHAAVGDTFAFSAFLRTFEVSIHFCFLFRCGELSHQFAFWSQYHKGNAKHRIGTCGKDGKFKITVFYLKLHFSTFRTANPVLLCFLQRIRPVNAVQSVEQTLCISRHTQTPLAHFLLHHRITATFTHAVHHFVISQHRTQFGTPVHHCFAQISNAVVHQHFLLLFFVHCLPFVGRKLQFLAASHVQVRRAVGFEMSHQFADRASLLTFVAVVASKHLLESPLRPVIIFRVTSTYLAVPVEREPDFIQLFAVAVDIVDRCDSRMLSRLDGILLSRQTVSIVSHRIEYIEALQSFVAGINVRSNVSQRVTHMQSRTRRIREHIQDIKFLLRFVFRNLVGLVLHPPFLPLLFNFPEIVLHSDKLFIYSDLYNSSILGTKIQEYFHKVGFTC